MNRIRLKHCSLDLRHWHGQPEAHFEFGGSDGGAYLGGREELIQVGVELLRLASVSPAAAINVYATAAPATVATFDLIAHMHRAIAFSERTFGPGERTRGLVHHIVKELLEVLESNGALEEWVDVIILGLDGAWRSGNTPEQIAAAIEAKQTKNEGRRWPDWRTAPAGQAIEHVRDELGTTP